MNTDIEFDKYTYTEGAGDGSTYGLHNAHHTQALYVTNENTGEEREYMGWTYMDMDYWNEDLAEAGMTDEDMQMQNEDLQEMLAAIWANDESWGYGIEDMPFTVV